MVPLKFCGLYTIIASTNPMYIGTKINIDYNHIRVSLVKKVGPIIINKNIYGSMFIKENTNSVKIQWLNSGNYEIDLIILPLITYPYIKDNCKRMNCEYSVDETNTWITIKDVKEQYILRKNINSKKNEDTFIKIVCTQLLINYIIGIIQSIH